jgi:hypothetical protein
MATKKRYGAQQRGKAARLVGVAKELADARLRAEKADPRRPWSYSRIAFAAGVAPETVYRALTGKTRYPQEHIEERFRRAIAAMNEAASAKRAA